MDSPRRVSAWLYRRRARISGVTLRIFLVDDHEVVRRGVRDLLENEDDFEVIGEAGTV